MSGEPPIGDVCWACGHVHRDESGCGAGPKPKENVVAADFGGSPYVELGTMAEEIRAVIDKYALRTALAETLGVLEIVKLELFEQAKRQ